MPITGHAGRGWNPLPYALCLELAREKGTACRKIFRWIHCRRLCLQFRRLAEELEEDSGLNCSDLWGMGLDQLPDELGSLLVTEFRS